MPLRTTISCIKIRVQTNEESISGGVREWLFGCQSWVGSIEHLKVRYMFSYIQVKGLKEVERFKDEVEVILNSPERETIPAREMRLASKYLYEK